MIKTNYECDRCGGEREGKPYNYPKGWKSISIKYKDGEYKYEKTKEYHLCENCARDLEIIPTENEKIQDKNIADKLIEILEEIAGNYFNRVTHD